MKLTRKPVVLVAPDSFKGTMGAREVAAALAEGLGPECEVDLCPLADGGEGTTQILVAALGGEVRTAAASDPLGRPVEASYGRVGELAIVDVAAASGLALLSEDERNPESATSGGTGELIAAALADGSTRIVVACGGSATVDGGAGAIAAIEASGGLHGATLSVLCDVITPIELAAQTYGPQKGADEAAVARLAARLDAFAAGLRRDPRGVAMSGSAGGLSGGLWGALGAELILGAAFVLDAVGFNQRLRNADLVITGEGRLDATSFEGKVVGAVAEAAAAAGVPVHAVVGSIAEGFHEPREGLSSVTIASDAQALERAGAEIARELSG